MTRLPPIRTDEALPAWRWVQIINGSPVREEERTCVLLSLSLDERLHDEVLVLLTEQTRRTEGRRAVVRARKKESPHG